MKQMLFRNIGLFLWCMTVHHFLSAQEITLDSISHSFANFNNQVYQEKLFLHTDKQFYLTGESINFKAYLVDVKGHMKSSLSKVVYVELIGDDSTVHLQTKVSVQQHDLGGSLFLPANLNSGSYVIRAYTRWMRNFDAAFYFRRNIVVFNPFKPMAFGPLSEQNYDVQFFPEGGYSVTGINGKVGMRVVNDKGKSIAYKGFVLSNENDTVAYFSSLKFGMGNFKYTPLSGENYTAHIYDPDQQLIVSKLLPKAMSQGYVLSLKDNADQIQIEINTHGATDQHQTLYLFIHCRGNIISATTQTLSNRKSLLNLSKTKLGDGINHITLFNHAGIPIAERLFFKKPAAGGNVEIVTNRRIYNPREKVELEINSHQFIDQEGEFSLSVYRTDKLQPPEQINIKNYLLLSADIKGKIESPWYYFTDDSLSDQAADNLMLVQGWRKFNWEKILTQRTWKMEYIPEFNAPILEGLVRHKSSGEPAKNKYLYLSRPGKDFVFRGAKSGLDGKVYFEMNKVYGKGKVYAIMSEENDSLFDIDLYAGYSKDFYITKSTPIDFDIQYKTALEDRSVGMQLSHIFNRYENGIQSTDSLHFYGIPDDQYYLDRFTRFPVMEEVMREYIRGIMVRKPEGNFQFTAFNLEDGQLFDRRPLVLLDGLPIFDMNKIMELDPFTIERIDVKRRNEFYGALVFEGIVSIVSYEGNLAYQMLSQDLSSIDYDGLQKQRMYFTPEYDVDTQIKSRIPDFRDVLYWNSSIKFKEAENVLMRFFTSDATGKYHITLNGISTTGNLFVGEANIIVEE